MSLNTVGRYLGIQRHLASENLINFYKNIPSTVVK